MFNGLKKLNEEIFFCLGKKITVKTLGVMRFEKFVMYNEAGEIIYWVAKNISALSASEDNKIWRHEYFLGECQREYRKWRNSFIEFCRALSGFKTLPPEEEILALAKKLKINRRVAKLYFFHYKKFFA